MTTERDAFDDMTKRLNDIWAANSITIVGTAPKILFPSKVETAKDIPADDFWARFWKTNDAATQRSLSRPAIFTTTGMLFVQIFAPASLKQAAIQGRALAMLARDAYRGITTPNGVWYRDVLIREMLPEPKWFPYRVSARYSFDEVV